MKLRKVSCNGCGAPVRVAANAKFITCRHCEVTLEVMRDGETIWTEERVEEIASNVADLELEVALMKLDRRWEQERESYYVPVEGGRPRPPMARGGLGIVIFAFVALVVSLPFNYFVGLVIFGVSMITSLFVSAENARARKYEAAQRRYRKRRRALIREAKEKGAA